MYVSHCSRVKTSPSIAKRTRSRDRLSEEEAVVKKAKFLSDTVSEKVRASRLVVFLHYCSHLQMH